jgi:hypothetical protein
LRDGYLFSKQDCSGTPVFFASPSSEIVQNSEYVPETVSMKKNHLFPLGFPFFHSEYLSAPGYSRIGQLVRYSANATPVQCQR